MDCSEGIASGILLVLRGGTTVRDEIFGGMAFILRKNVCFMILFYLLMLISTCKTLDNPEKGMYPFQPFLGRSKSQFSSHSEL